MNSCEYFQRKMSDYHDDGRELPSDVLRHLKECAECSRFHSMLLSQSRILNNLPGEPRPNDENKKRTLLNRIWDAKLTVRLPIAAVFLLFVLGLYMLNAVGQHRRSYPDSQNNQNTSGLQELQVIVFSPQTASVSDN